MFSRIVRRSHMYLALFLSPWLLMYALSTMVMNHREWFAGTAPFVRESEMPFDAGPVSSGPADMASRILVSLDLDGAHTVSRRQDGTLVINRSGLVSPRRITYTPASGNLLVEKQEFRPSNFLNRFHRRRGYATGYGLDTVWAVTVDLTIAALVFWTASGIWMWWGIRPARAAGAAALLGGIGLFLAFVFLI